MNQDMNIINYAAVDYMTQRRLQMLLWLARFGQYESTTQYTASV